MGADCGDAYTATRLVLKLGRRDTLADRDQSALNAALSLQGTEAEGQGWSGVVDGGLLLVGLPDAARVLSLPRDSAATLLDELDAPVLTSSAADGLGASLARVALDGAMDLWVGAPDLDGPGVEAGAGGVYRFAGLGDGWTGQKSTEEASLRVLSESARDQLGRSMAGCADLDGDGGGELLIAAPWDDESAALAGKVYLIESAKIASYQREILAGELDRAWTGDSRGAQLGRAMLCDSDLDGDGAAELLLGAPLSSAVNRTGAGAVFALGGDAGAGPADEAAAWQVRGPRADDYLGWSIAAGDMDGDGYPELAIGAPGTDRGRGQVQLIQGSSLLEGDRKPRSRVLGEGERDQVGRSVVIGHLDGDGLADLAVGAPGHSGGGFDAGAVLLFAGEAGLATWSLARSPEDADGVIRGDEQLLRVGDQVLIADWDEDGAGDLLMFLSAQPP